MIEVVSAAIVADKRLLLAQRASKASYAWKFHTPGGYVEPVDNGCHYAALARKLPQELAIDLVSKPRSVVYVHDIRSTRTGGMLRVYCYELRIEDVSGAMQARCLDKTIGVAWFSRSDLAALDLAPADNANRNALSDLMR